MIASIVFWAALYIVIWWITLFAVLPWGVHSQAERGKVVRGSERGAPVRPLMRKKLIATTLIAAIILGVGYILQISGFIDRYVLPPQYTAGRLH
jgi:predicted secreted protein